MKIFKKEFKITQLLDNRNEFTVIEIFYILGISVWYRSYGVDGKNGDIPFQLLSSAKSLKKELERKESKDKIYRNNILCWVAAILCFVILQKLILK